MLTFLQPTIYLLLIFHDLFQYDCAEPIYTDDDLKKNYENYKHEIQMLQYDELNDQQKEIIGKVQAMIVVVNDNLNTKIPWV